MELELTEKELSINAGNWAAETLTAGGDILGGATIGAAFGSVIPVVGTLAGAVVGGLYGGVAYIISYGIDHS